MRSKYVDAWRYILTKYGGLERLLERVRLGEQFSIEVSELREYGKRSNWNGKVEMSNRGLKGLSGAHLNALNEILPEYLRPEEKIECSVKDTSGRLFFDMRLRLGPPPKEAIGTQRRLAPEPALSLGPIQNVLQRVNLSEPVAVGPEDKLVSALRIMEEKDFSQLPVVKGDKFFGLVSYKSIVRSLKRNLDLQSPKVISAIGNFLELPVKHFIDQRVKFLSLDDDIFELFDMTKQEDVVLIGEKRRSPKYIVTNYDIVNILQKLSNVFLLIQQIEHYIREIVRKQFSLHRITLGEIVPKINEKLPESMYLPDDIEKMTITNYKTLIVHGFCWKDYFSEVFTDKEFLKHLDFVNAIRNDVFHFRRLSYTLDDSEIEKLSQIRDWISSLV